MLGENLKKLLFDVGASLVGFGNMSGVKNCIYPYGISVAIPVCADIVKEIEQGPTLSYYEEYHSLNSRLNSIVTYGAEFLIKAGYNALPQTTDIVKQDENMCSAVPHKTVAVKANLGWIGKSGLLVTPTYGSAVRISSILTDAPLKCSTAIYKSRCGTCDICVKSCPANALSGVNWHEGILREELFDKDKCNKKELELMRQRTGIEADLCGKCFVVCPYTRKYIAQKL